MTASAQDAFGAGDVDLQAGRELLAVFHLDGEQAPTVPAQRKARREYEHRINTLVADVQR